MADLQKRQSDWAWQWEHFRDHEEWLFHDWLFPLTMHDFRGKRVLDAGCGGGQHMSFVAPYASEVVGVDLNASHVAREYLSHFSNTMTVDGDIAKIDFLEKFDIVYCIGVIHHTDNPDLTFQNLARATKIGGKTVIWCYSKEGNWLNEFMLEPLKHLIFFKFSKPALRLISKVMTALLYIPVYTVYLLPLPFLPYFEYFKNFRKLHFMRNDLNVFDKLNAPQTDFISKKRFQSWFDQNGYRDIHLSSYKGVSWRGSGIKV